MKKIMQLRYRGVGKDNLPSDEKDWKFNLLSKYGNVSHLGIQGEPGVVFYLNSGHNPIQLGNTGIYEIDLEGLGYITKLYFDMETLHRLYPETNENDKHLLIVDFVYNSAEV